MITSATSIESLNAFSELRPELRRASASRSSQSSAFDALFLSEEDGIGIASSPNSSTSPCVPTVVMMCIRHLEQFGLHTVGIFRVSSSKRRVRQVRYSTIICTNQVDVEIKGQEVKLCMLLTKYPRNLFYIKYSIKSSVVLFRLF